MDFTELESHLKKYSQEHLLRFWNDLDATERNAFAAELGAIDFASLTELIGEYVAKQPENALPSPLAPAPYFPLKPADAAMEELYCRARAEGKALLARGEVACITVAGGQGTRLGFDGPKGSYPIGPVSGKSLFGYFAESIIGNQLRYGKEIPWYIMTSLINDSATREFFAANSYFGLKPEQVFFFTQGTMPAIGYDGKLLLAGKGALALSPDGHGGTLWALRKSGALADMEQRGIKYLSYFQVDNPLVPVVDPLFIGLHALEGAQVSAIMLAKTGPFEKLGNFCASGGRTYIIEYSDLPDELAESRNADGSLRFIAGSPAIHVFSCAFIDVLTSQGKPSLPWHRADKKVPFIDDSGSEVKPAEPNAVKLESFIFDALPLAEKVMIIEGRREDVFGPTKNATGVDSAESCRELLVARDLRRLAEAGVDTAAAKLVEISPQVAVDAEGVREYCRKNNISDLIGRGDKVYLD